MPIRPATPADALAIAALHADSWQRTYRGVLSDRYLDEQVLAERQADWTERLNKPAPQQRLIMLEDDSGLLGFSCVMLDEDADWGCYLNNLHVRHDQQGRGLGRELMVASAALCSAARLPGLYLWVLQANRQAQGFYARLGGREADSDGWDTPDGRRVPVLRYVWARSADLLQGRESRQQT